MHIILFFYILHIYSQIKGSEKQYRFCWVFLHYLTQNFPNLYFHEVVFFPMGHLLTYLGALIWGNSVCKHFTGGQGTASQGKKGPGVPSPLVIAAIMFSSWGGGQDWVDVHDCLKGFGPEMWPCMQITYSLNQIQGTVQILKNHVASQITV